MIYELVSHLKDYLTKNILANFGVRIRSLAPNSMLTPKFGQGYIFNS